MHLASPSPLLAHLERQLAEVRRGADPEAAHQARVASRRLRAWATLTGQPELAEELRWLGRAMGAVRDLDVLATTPLALDPRVASSFRSRHAQARDAARRALGSPRCGALLAALRAAVALAPRGARKNLRDLEADARRQARRWRRSHGQAVATQLRTLHRLRRALRRLRYAREWAGQQTRPLVGPLSAMGRACDLLAMRRFLKAWAADAGLDPRLALEPLDAGLADALETLRRGLPRRGW